MSRLTEAELHLDRAFCQSEPVAALLRRALADVARGLEAEEATIWTISEDGARLEATLNHGEHAEIMEALSVPADDSVVGMVAQSGLATAIGPDDWQNRTVIDALGIETRALVAAPLLLDGEIIGVLTAFNPRERPIFDDGSILQVEWHAYVMALVLADHCGSTA